MPATANHNAKKAILLVLDGFGIGKDSPFNAIRNARKPFFTELLNKYPHSQLLTHGEYVGLPDGTMGNSEVGHATMGAGRILYQDLTRINAAIRTKDFFKNPVLLGAMQAGQSARERVHLMGLLSDGGVHSHISHLEALLDLALAQGVEKIYVHAFLDGRDTPPDSSIGFVNRLLTHPAFQNGRAKIASIGGRYYAMDRDNRWERVAQAFSAMTGQAEVLAPGSKKNLAELLTQFHGENKSDEFFSPTLLEKDGAIGEDDTCIFFNYRSDRARELSIAFNAFSGGRTKNFNSEFNAGFASLHFPKIKNWVTMTQYDPQLVFKTVFPPQSTENIFAQVLQNAKLKQLRTAETEKYAHVTFFFNNGIETPFIGEDRVLIPSAKEVATYDLKPEMSVFEIAQSASDKIMSEVYDFVLINFANADMVGHTGNYAATVHAIEALDKAVAQVVGAAERSGYHLLITADHGNAEEMCDHSGKNHTQHTLNPVPAIWVRPNSWSAPRTERYALRDGGLADVMPTLCDLMQLPIPEEVTGKTLLKPE